MLLLSLMGCSFWPRTVDREPPREPEIDYCQWGQCRWRNDVSFEAPMSPTLVGYQVCIGLAEDPDNDLSVETEPDAFEVYDEPGLHLEVRYRWEVGWGAWETTVNGVPSNALDSHRTTVCHQVADIVRRHRAANP